MKNRLKDICAVSFPVICAMFLGVDSTEYLPVFILFVISALVLIFLMDKTVKIKHLLFAFLFISLCCVRCHETYLTKIKYTTETVENLSDATHLFSGYVSEQDTKSSGGMFFEITHIDSNKTEYPIKTYGYNSHGHFYEEGTFLEFSGTLKIPENTTADFDKISYLSGKGVFCELIFDSEVKTNPEYNKFSLGKTLRNFVYNCVSPMLNNIYSKDRFENSSSLAKALMFGNKSGFSEESLENFRICGITHILCVSGLHFSVIITGLSFILNKIIHKRKFRIPIIMLFSVIYLTMCAFSKSAMRAAIMSLFSVIGIEREKGTRSILYALCIICLIDPCSVFDASLRLSVLSTLGIVCSVNFFKKWLSKFNSLPIIKSLLELVLISVGAFTFTVIYTAFDFGGFSVLSVVCSVLCVNAAQLCLTILWICVPFGLFGLGYLFSGLYDLVSNYIFSITEFFAKIENAYIPVNFEDFSSVVFFVIIIFSALMANTSSGASKLYFYALIFSIIFFIFSFIIKLVY